METAIVVLVLIVLFVLLGGAAWFFGREAGAGNGAAFLNGSRQLRSMFQPLTERARPFTSQAQPPAIVMDDTPVRELAEELRGELSRAIALSREFDARLNALEHDLNSQKQLPEKIDARVQSAQSDARDRIARLRHDLNQSRKADSPYSVRRNDAVSDLYQKLAQIEVCLGNVINPMLLPGERVSVPDSLFDDTMEWENWQEVGDRAYVFGESFSQNRYLLSTDLSDQTEAFIGAFREALTSTVYPVVQNPNRTLQQRTQMRSGLVAVVEAIAPLRRSFEETWLTGTTIDGFSDDDEEFNA